MSKYQAPLNWNTGGGSDTDIAAPINSGRRALLIGIDKYSNFDPEWQLNGCVNDILIMRELLVGKFGFLDSEVITLVNEQATREGILAAMEALLHQVGKDDIVVFHYSGHGSRQVDGPERDELDGYDKTLVPYDSGRPPYANRDITDDEIYTWLRRLIEATSFITLIFDCCYPMSVLCGNFGDDVQRDLPVPKPVFEPVSPHEAVSSLVEPDWVARYSVSMEKKYVLMAACLSQELAHEDLINERVVHGALSASLVKILADPNFRNATWREVWEDLYPLINIQYPMQHPRIEGALDREVFGVGEKCTSPFLRVLDREDDVIVLSAGAACGLEVGSYWRVCMPQPYSAQDEDFSGLVEIVDVGVTSSKARIFEEKLAGQIYAGLRAVEADHSTGKIRFALQIVAPSENPQVRLLLECVSRSRFLRRVAINECADARVYLLMPRTCVTPEDPAPMLGQISEDTWVIVGPDGNLLAPSFPCRHPDALKSVLWNLENVARLRSIFRIYNADNVLGGQIDFLLHRLDAGQCAAPSAEFNGEPVFFEGDRLVLEIRNRSRIPLYVYLLHVSLMGGSKQVFPPLGSHELLQRGRRIQLGMREGQEFRLFIPKDFLLLQKTLDGKTLEGRETFKLFAMSTPCDLSLLHLPSFLSPWGGNSTTQRSRGSQAKESWITIERTFLLRSQSSSGVGA